VSIERNCFQTTASFWGRVLLITFKLPGKARIPGIVINCRRAEFHSPLVDPEFESVGIRPLKPAWSGGGVVGRACFFCEHTEIPLPVAQTLFGEDIPHAIQPHCLLSSGGFAPGLGLSLGGLAGVGVEMT
jgi:hypothetical protein